MDPETIGGNAANQAVAAAAAAARTDPKAMALLAHLSGAGGPPPPLPVELLHTNDATKAAFYTQLQKVAEHMRARYPQYLKAV